MKNTLFLFLTLLTAASATAQPTLTVETQTPTFTENYTAAYMEVSGSFSPGPGGANQNWVFTNLPAPELTTGMALAPTSFGQNSEDYPGADFVWILAGLGAQNYYTIEGDNMRLMGGVGLNFSGDVVTQVVYSQGETGLQYPITFNTTYNYSSTFTTTVFGTTTFPGLRNGTVTADGYGTITTPYGTYEDVLRLVISSTDSEGLSETQYSWLQAGTFVPVMVYTTNSDPEVLDNVYYSRFDGISSTQELAYNYGLKIAGNPLRDRIQLVGALEELTRLDIQVVNQLGQRMEAQLVGDQISLSAGPAGTYYLLLSGERGQQLLSFVRQ
ncbi:MAG: hypothetical protein AAF433_00315 [Bacteroidota bacterium]